jgi:hypothetical protein
MNGPEPGLTEIQDAITELLRDEEVATLATLDADGARPLTAKRRYDAVAGRRS